MRNLPRADVRKGPDFRRVVVGLPCCLASLPASRFSPGDAFRPLSRRVARGAAFSALARGDVGDEFDEGHFVDGRVLRLWERGGGGDGGDVDGSSADADGLG